MSENKYTEDTDKKVSELITNRILRHTVQFFKKGKKRLEPFGSGVFAKIHNDYFIITASHVADFFEKTPSEDLSIRVNKKSFINVLGDIKYTDIEKSKGIDLAYIKLDKQMIEPLSKPYIPIETDKIRSHHNLFYAMNYCVLGFPETNVTKENEPLDTGASFYLTSASKDNRYEKYMYDKKDYIIVNIEGKGTDIKTGDKTKVNTHFYGISGCGLWLLLFYKNPATGKDEIDYRLVGIMTEFKNSKYFCLIANKIYLLIEALKVIEKYKFKEIKIQY
ncbi:hypothetical protein V1387_16615 [Allomuricauda taeanensis]|uniref:hypothetical protein n=1 Tax=Flagellimonas taeanensis TaxID=1005926 RepID=UPI002E7C3FBD|nr:hypothetical protein [Allomuricauda taeanensis]MEE1964316.1 hypothetical protein [Allomuricauda taeanensis]